MPNYGYVRVIEDDLSELCKTQSIQRRQVQIFSELRMVFVDQFFIEHSYNLDTPFLRRFEGTRLASILQAGDLVIASHLDRLFGHADDVAATINFFRQRQADLWVADCGGSVLSAAVSGALGLYLAKAA
jgi:hypothetical protein